MVMILLQEPQSALQHINDLLGVNENHENPEKVSLAVVKIFCSQYIIEVKTSSGWPL